MPSYPCGGASLGVTFIIVVEFSEPGGNGESCNMGTQMRLSKRSACFPAIHFSQPKGTHNVRV